jgi:Patatin-like phospholipase
MKTVFAALPSRPSRFSWLRPMFRTFALAALFLLVACGSVPRAPYEPAPDDALTVAGIPNARIWADGSPAELAQSNVVLRASAPVTGDHVNILALSGGGSGGAFGAGLLAGWTARGDRPAFDVVTGVSTGALIAPYAFLGSEYDAQLTKAFSPEETAALNKGVTPFRVLFSNGISDNAALKRLIDTLVTPALLRSVAVEHARGRRLLVLTTNLDAQRPVIWDMGVIAGSGSPTSLALFRRVLLASSSIPGLYPAVRIPISGHDGPYEELHTDGGVFAQLFVGPDALMTSGVLGLQPDGVTLDLYVVINNALDPAFSVTPDSILGVVARSYETFLKSHARATINSTYLFAQSQGFPFHLAYLEENVPYDFREPFAPDYLSRVYALGFQTGITGDWRSQPPSGDGSTGSGRAPPVVLSAN